MAEQQIMLKDSEWNVVEDALCRVKEFTPMASIQNGKVLTLGKAVPYASVTLECEKIPQPIKGFITHQTDFKHLWAAFKERPLGQNEEVLVFWSKKHYKGLANLFSRSMPRLWVMVCRKEAFELMTNRSFRPELHGEARFDAMKPITEWKPKVMK